MRRAFFCLLFFLPFFSKAQNLPQCDSLVISCCTFDSLGPNTVTLLVSNPSSELFDYPGFVLLDASMDTIAKETVNYFGIGTWPQAHTMTILSPLTLPFTGYLELYTLFYQSFACSFPFTIADTATSVTEYSSESEVIVFPNPCTDELHVDLSGSSADSEVILAIVDVAGREVYAPNKKQLPATLLLNGIKPGLYLLRITNTKDQLIKFQKVMVRG
jgi:hypothetical protein